MIDQRFPKGWDEKRVQNPPAELDSRTDEEWIADDEATASSEGDQTVITVPAVLLPEIRRLIASHEKSCAPFDSAKCRDADPAKSND